MFTKTCSLISAFMKCVLLRQQFWQYLLTAAGILQDCVTATRQFAYEREWKCHMEEHNKHWLCPYGCVGQYESLSEFRSHLQLQHTVAETMVPSLSNSCARVKTIRTTVACPLCLQVAPSYDKWLKHVGHHLRQLALFAIPSRLTSSNSEDELDANAEDEVNQAVMDNEDFCASDDGEQSDRENYMADKFDADTQAASHGVGQSEGHTTSALSPTSPPDTAWNHIPVDDPTSQAPYYRIYRRLLQGELPDPTAPLIFSPPKDSDELFDSLRAKYPHLKSHGERMREAETEFLLHESQSSRVASPKQTSEPASDVEMYDAPPVGESESDVESMSTDRRGSQASEDQRDYILDLERTPSNDRTQQWQQGQPKRPLIFQCTLCPKRFTRAYNLRSHLRTHTDERPFVCTVCGKAFARQHDRKRHEGLHSGEKKFVCRGTLQSTANWGCGRRFGRADALGRHFRSEAGRVCIKPLLDKEAAERQKAWLEKQQQVQVAAGLVVPQPLLAQPHMNMMDNFLPTAILQQYPALAGLDWNLLP